MQKCKKLESTQKFKTKNKIGCQLLVQKRVKMQKAKKYKKNPTKIPLRRQLLIPKIKRAKKLQKTPKRKKNKKCKKSKKQIL